jgi:DNA polymerase-3 subunit beta
MDFRIGKNDLLRGLYLAHGIADRKNTIPILANVLVRTSGKDKVMFAATDLKIAMIVNATAKIAEEGGITVGAKDLVETRFAWSEPSRTGCIFSAEGPSSRSWA